MSNKHDKDQRRKKKLREREQAKKPRTAIIRDGEKRTVIQQGNAKGYDIEMIRDFLDHLLLEVRVQHYENQKLLKALGAMDDLKTAMKVTEDISEKLVKQLQPYQNKYQSALIAANVVDGTNASDAEVKGVMTAILMGMQAKRDEQIGHLEALQDIFKEALHCARLPFGVDKDGNPIMAQIVHSVRELADEAFLSDLPTYEDLLPLFSDHRFATQEGIQTLKDHDRSIIIVAENDRYDTPLVLYGAELIEQQEKAGKTEMKVRAFPVESYSELQFTIAAIAKYVGVPSTDGEPWKDL